MQGRLAVGRDGWRRRGVRGIAGGTMENELLADRRKALEEEFFRKENERQRAALQARKKRDESKAALRETGIGDDALIDRLLDLGVAAEAVVALELAPLVAVAWADGTLDDRERAAVLRAARHD